MDSIGHTPVLLQTLEKLEDEAKIYIERMPCVSNESVKRDIQPTDIIYVDCYPSITRRSLLYKTGVEYGNYTINHVLGCSHGCTYPCYAMNISKRYGRVSSYEDWMHPRIVENAMELLEKEIPKYKVDIDFVHLSFMTDPFMYDIVNDRNIPWVEKLTLKIIQKLNLSGIKVTVLTKGIYPLDLIHEEYSRNNEYGITLVSLDSQFQSEYEPFSPLSLDRIMALKAISDSGLKTWASIEPYPTPNIVEQNLDDLLKKIDFVDKIVFGKWNYNPLVNGYGDKKSFYTRCSDKVIKFSEDKGISFHIKAKTPRSSKSTETLFQN